MKHRAGTCTATLLAAIAGLAGCSSLQQETLTRNAAKTAIRPVLADTFPGLPVEPASDCVIDSATSNELFILAADAVTGPTASTVEMVADIAARPKTLTCFAGSGLSALAGGA